MHQQKGGIHTGYETEKVISSPPWAVRILTLGKKAFLEKLFCGLGEAEKLHSKTAIFFSAVLGRVLLL